MSWLDRLLGRSEKGVDEAEGAPAPREATYEEQAGAAEEQPAEEPAAQDDDSRPH